LNSAVLREIRELRTSWHGTCFIDAQNDLECWPARAV
jgi:hypothetical protein